MLLPTSSLRCSVLAVACLLVACNDPAPSPTEGLGVTRQGFEQGDLVISEVFYDPSDAALGREWFEVTNVSSTSIDMKGINIISGEFFGAKPLTVHAIATSVVVPPGGQVVLGQSAASDVNGGVPVAYAYGTDLQLAPKGTKPFLLLESEEGSDVDDVLYLAEPPWPVLDGTSSLSLDPANLSIGANDEAANWCLSTKFFSDSVQGTPGTANEPCPQGAGGEGGQGGAGAGGSAGSSATGGAGQAGAGGSGQAGSGGAPQPGQAGTSGQPAATASETSDDGCGCRTAPGGRGAGWGGACLVGLAALGRRRRARG